MAQTRVSFGQDSEVGRLGGRDGFDRVLTASSLVPALCLFVPLLVPLVTGRVFASDDLGTFHLPFRFLYSSALGEGHSILWTPQAFNGFYVHAEGQVGILHPLHIVLYRVFPLGVAFNLELILSYVCAFFGMWVFLNRVGLRAPASIAGATAFTFSGFSLLHLTHLNAVSIAAHIPWLLTAVDVLLTGPRRARPVAFSAIALMGGSQVLLGYPQYLWMSALTCALYALVRAWQLAAWTWVPVAAVAAAVGLLVGGAQLLPTIDLLAGSVRATVPQDFILSFSLEPLNLLQLWSPYVSPGRVYAVSTENVAHEFGVYNGALCTLAIIWTFLRRRQLKLPWIAAFAATLSSVAIVLALGRYGLVYEHLTAVLPLDKFRAPARHILLLHLGLSVLAAIAFDDLIGLVRQRRRPDIRLAWVGAAVAFSALTAACAWLAPDVFTSATGGRPELTRSLSSVALLGSATLLVSGAALGNRIALFALPLFAAVDLGVWGYSYVWARPPRTIAETSAGAQLPPSFSAGTTIHLPGCRARCNLVLLHGLKLLQPYVGLPPSRALSADHREVHRLAGVEWVRTGSEWQSITDPMPRVRALFEAQPSTDPARDLDTIDVSRTALVPAAIPDLQNGAVVKAHLVVDEPGRIDVNIAAGGRALLVTTESYHQGWAASADGRQLATIPIYGDYLGVSLEPGNYRLTLRFVPASARYGIALSAAGVLLTLAVGLAAIWMKSESEQAP
jgi:Bacterial membrane protein YfhO